MTRREIEHQKPPGPPESAPDHSRQTAGRALAAEILDANQTAAADDDHLADQQAPARPKRQLAPETRAKISRANKGRELSPEHRARISRANKGRKLSPEHKAKLIQANKGKKRSPETRAKISRAQKGRKFTPEHRARISQANKGRKIPPETRAKMSQAQKGKRVSPETRAKMSQAQKGKRVSPETRAKISQVQKGKRVSPETRAKMSQVQKGKKVSPETRAKISRGNKGKELSPETRAKMSHSTKGAKNHRYDKSIDAIKRAIEENVWGQTMSQASRNQGYESSWLSGWKRQHPDRFATYYQEAGTRMQQAALDRAIRIHVGDNVSMATASRRAGLPDDFLEDWARQNLKLFGEIAEEIGQTDPERVQPRP